MIPRRFFFKPFFFILRCSYQKYNTVYLILLLKYNVKIHLIMFRRFKKLVAQREDHEDLPFCRRFSSLEKIIP